MVTGENYPFLELITESEAASQGLYPADRYIYAVYKSLLAASDLTHAKSGKLFSLTSPVLEVNDITRQDRINALKRLISDRLAAMLFYLQYFPEKTGLELIPVFISAKDEDPRLPLSVFEELASMSANAVLLLSDAKTGAGLDLKLLWQDLENDMKGNASKKPAGLNTVTDPLLSFRSAEFPLRPHTELIPATLNRIEEKMIESGKFVKLRGFGFLPVRPYDLTGIYELCSDFLSARIIPFYRDKGNLKRELNEIQLAETSYYFDEFVPKSSSFAARRARAVRKAVTGSDSDSAQISNFPGSLACEIILQLERRVQTAYEEEHRKSVQQRLSEIRERFLNGKNWRDIILFFDEEEYASLDPDVRAGIQNDSRLIGATWEEERGTVTVFAPRDINQMRRAITQMFDADGTEFWKVLAIRQLIDQNNALYSEMFQDQEFVKVYGKLLRMVYLTYISWIHRFLFWLGITLFQDSAFREAKKVIAAEQASRGEKNRIRQNKIKEKKEAEKKAILERLAGNSQLNRIIEALDWFYFTEETVPSFEDLKRYLKTEDEQGLRNQLKEDRFQLIEADSDETPGDAIVVYPADFDWNTKSARLLRITDRIREKLSGKDDFESKFRLKRIKKLTEFIIKSRKSGRYKDVLRREEDPYEKLERVIRQKKGAEEIR